MAHPTSVLPASSEAGTLIVATLIAAFIGYGVGTTTADIGFSAPQSAAPTNLPDWHGNVMRSNH